MRAKCTVWGHAIRTGDAVCIVGFAPKEYPERATLVTKATAERLRIAGWLLGIAETRGRAALAGDPIDVVVGARDLAPPGEDTLVVDLWRENPAVLDGALSEFGVYELVGHLGEDARVIVPQEAGWSAEFVDRTTTRGDVRRKVVIAADVRGGGVATMRGVPLKVRVELEGGDYRVVVADRSP